MEQEISRTIVSGITSLKNTTNKIVSKSSLKLKNSLKQDTFQKTKNEKKEKVHKKDNSHVKGLKKQKNIEKENFSKNAFSSLLPKQEDNYKQNSQYENTSLDNEEPSSTESIQHPFNVNNQQNQDLENSNQLLSTESIQHPFNVNNQQNQDLENSNQLLSTESIQLPLDDSNQLSSTESIQLPLDDSNQPSSTESIQLPFSVNNPQVMFASYSIQANSNYDYPIQNIDYLSELMPLPYLDIIQTNDMEKNIDYSAIENKVSQLIDTETEYTFDEYGQEVIYRKLENPKYGEYSGSNDGFWLYNDQNHKLFWVKQCGEQSKAEVIASKLYKEANIPSASMDFCFIDGKGSVLSQFIPNLEQINMQNYDQKKELYRGFGMDVLLANWDAVISDNAQVSSNCTYRIDFGGCFNFRAQAKNGLSPLKFTCFPHAIQTLINPSYNEESSEAYSGMTYNDLADSLKRVLDISDETICNILDEQKMAHFKPTILKRKQFLNLILNEINNTQSYENFVDVNTMNHIISDVLYSSIENAKTIAELNDIDNALYNIDDETDKEYLLDFLGEKKSELQNKQNFQLQPKSISKEDVIKNVLNYDKGNSYQYIKYVTPFINKNYSSKASELITLLNKPLTNNDIELMTKVLNVCNGKYIDTFTKDEKTCQDFIMFFKVLNLFNDLQKNFHDIKEPQWGAIVNTFNNRANIQEMQSVFDYKLSSADINATLTNKKIAIIKNMIAKWKIQSII